MTKYVPQFGAMLLSFITAFMLCVSVIDFHLVVISWLLGAIFGSAWMCAVLLKVLDRHSDAEGNEHVP